MVNVPWCHDCNQPDGLCKCEAMKPSPSPAAMTDEVHKIAEIIDPDAFAHIESADDYPAWRARREACKFAALQKAEAIDALLASRGTRALTEEEIDAVWNALRERVCSSKLEAKRCVMVSHADLTHAMRAKSTPQGAEE